MLVGSIFGSSQNSINKESPRLAPMFLKDLGLIIQDKRQQNRLGLVINPKNDQGIMPIAFIEINDLSLVDRRLELEFKLLPPIGKEQTFGVTPLLQAGENRIVPPVRYTFGSRTRESIWVLELWASGRFWGRREFSFTTKTINSLANELIGSDLEIREGAEKRIEVLAEKTSIDELLK